VFKHHAIDQTLSVFTNGSVWANTDVKSPQKCVETLWVWFGSVHCSWNANSQTVISVIDFTLKQFISCPVHWVFPQEKRCIEPHTELIYIHRFCSRFTSQHIYLVHYIFFDFGQGLFIWQIWPWFIPSLKQCILLLTIGVNINSAENRKSISGSFLKNRNWF